MEIYPPPPHYEIGFINMEPHERLRLAREKVFKTAKEAAETMGVSYVTYAAHETGRNGFANHAAKYAKVFHTTVDYLLTGRHPDTSASRQSAAIDVDGGGMIVRGYVRAGIWQEAYAVDGDAQTLPISADRRYPSHLQFALEIQGESINKRARPGEYAVCVEWRGPIQPNDIVVVERRRTGLFEATIKVAKIGPRNTVELWPDSDHAAHQTPIILDPNDARDGEEIAVVAKVLGFYRKA